MSGTEINLKRPKVALRKIECELTRLAIKEYALNRGTEAEEASLENLRRVIQ